MAARRPDDPSDRSDAVDETFDQELTTFIATCLEYAWNQPRPITEDDVVNLAIEHLQVPNKDPSRLRPVCKAVLQMLESDGWGKPSAKGWKVLRNEENTRRFVDVHRLLESRPGPAVTPGRGKARDKKFDVRTFNANLHRALSPRKGDGINASDGARKGPLEHQGSSAKEPSETVAPTNSEMPPASNGAAAGHAPPASDTDVEELPLNHAQIPRVEDLDDPNSGRFHALHAFCLSWAWKYEGPITKAAVANFIKEIVEPKDVEIPEVKLKKAVALLLVHLDTIGATVPGPQGRDIVRTKEIRRLVEENNKRFWDTAYQHVADAGYRHDHHDPRQDIDLDVVKSKRNLTRIEEIVRSQNLDNVGNIEHLRLALVHICFDWAWNREEAITIRSLSEFVATRLERRTDVSEDFRKMVVDHVWQILLDDGFIPINTKGRRHMDKTRTTEARLADLRTQLIGETFPQYSGVAEQTQDAQVRRASESVEESVPTERYVRVTVTGIDSGDGRRRGTEVLTFPSHATISDVRRELLQRDFGTPYRFYSEHLARVIEPDNEATTKVDDVGATLELRRISGTTKGKKQARAETAAAHPLCGHPSEACGQLDAVLGSLRSFALTKGRLKSSDIERTMTLLGGNVDLFFQGKEHGPHDSHDLVTHEVYRRLGAVVDRVEAELQLDASLPVGSLAALFQAIARASVRIDVADIEMNQHIGSIFERVARFIVRLCENPFKAPPEFISSLGGALLELTKGRADFFVWVATYRGLLTSVDMLLEASSVRQPELLVFAASITVFTDWVEFPSARPDLDRLAIWCIRSVACFTDSPMEFISTHSGNTYYGQIIIDHLVNSYCQHLLLFSDVDPAHLAYLPDLLDVMIATTPDSGIEIQFPVVLLKMADLSKRNPENGEFPGAHHDRLFRVLAALDAHNGNSTLRFAYSMDSLCKRVGFRRGIESAINTRALDSIVDNKEFTTFALDETCGTLPRRLSWLLEMTARAAVRYHKYYRALFQVLLVMQEHIPEDLDLITTRDDVWPSIMNILEGSSDYCPHSSLSLSVWRILALLSAYQGGSQVIVNCGLHEYTSVVADYIMNRYEPAFPDTPTGRSPNDDDEDDDSHYPNDAENRDFAELASLIGDVTISVLGYFPEMASSFRSAESMSELFDQGGDEDFNACYGSVLLQYSNPHDIAPWSEQLRMLYLVREIYDTVKMETDFPSNAHICFSLWNFLRCVHANGRKEVAVGTREKSITDIQLQFLAQLAANTKVDPLIRETAEDALLMAREAGFM